MWSMLAWSSKSPCSLSALNFLAQAFSSSEEALSLQPRSKIEWRLVRHYLFSFDVKEDWDYAHWLYRMVFVQGKECFCRQTHVAISLYEGLELSTSRVSIRQHLSNYGNSKPECQFVSIQASMVIANLSSLLESELDIQTWVYLSPAKSQQPVCQHKESLTCGVLDWTSQSAIMAWPWIESRKFAQT